MTVATSGIATNTAASSVNTNTTTTNTSSSASGSSSATSLASNFSTFLNLLTTQLQNQDPTNPVDSNQFTQQLVEFAGVQQQVQSNATLSQILSAVQGSAVSSASSYIGTTIQASGNQTSLSAGGTATIGYTLPETAGNVQVTIKDSSGNTVFQGAGTTTSGSNTVSWNGTNSFTGATEPAGVYTFSVTAADSNGNTITATPFITGTVQSASISNGTVELSLGNGLEVPSTNITSISNLPGASSESGLSSELSNLSSEIAALPSSLASDLQSIL